MTSVDVPNALNPTFLDGVNLKFLELADSVYILEGEFDLFKDPKSPTNGASLTVN